MNLKLPWQGEKLTWKCSSHIIQNKYLILVTDYCCVGFEIHTVVTMEFHLLGCNTGSLVEVCQCFGRTYCLHLSGQEIRQASTQQNAGGKHIDQGLKYVIPIN